MPKRLFASFLTVHQQVGLGLYGSEFINDTASHEPPSGFFYWCIVPKEDTVFTTLTDSLRETGNDPADGAEVHPQGIALTGYITEVQLTSGACWALIAPNQAP